MKYSKRELSMVNILSMALIGIGLLCLVLASVVWIHHGAAPPAAGPQGGENPFLGYLIGGLVFSSCGGALHFALRRIQAHGGEEPSADSEETVEPND